MTLLALALAATLSAGNAEFDAEANRTACDIALGRLRAETVEKGLVSGVLERAMLNDPARFAGTNAAERLCREVYAQALESQYRTAARSIVNQLGLVEMPTNGVAEALEDAVAKRFGEAYAAERASAVDVQARTIAGNVRPSEEDFETKDEATIRSEMTKKVADGQRTPVFEENLRYISEKIVDPVIADGRNEMKRQGEYVAFRAKCESYAPEAMARELEAALRRNVAEQQGKESDPTKAWGVFPGVLSKGLRPAVERRVTKRVEKNIDNVAVAIDRDSVLKTISADPEAHRKASDSEKIFRTAYAAQILGGAVDKTSQEAPEKERAAFSEFARAHLTARELSQAVEARLKREVLPQWKRMRDEVAKDEAGRLWPSLADRTWYPDAELADRMSARSDYAAALKGWREMPEMASLAKADGGRVVLEETSGAVDRSVASAFDLARSALAAQNAILDEVEPSVLRTARETKESVWRRTPDLKAIVALLTESVEREWGTRRLTTLWKDPESRPPNADVQHAALFPSVRRRIELVARSILEEMAKPDPEPEKKPEPEDPKPEDPVESDQQSEEEPLVMFSIVVQREGENVTVKLEQGKSTVVEKNAKARMSDYREAMKFVSDKLGTDILKLK